MLVTGKNNNYETKQRLGGNDLITYYTCGIASHSDEMRILAIATQAEHNPIIDRVAYLLKRLSERSDFFEEEYAAEPDHAEQKVHFDWLFPQVVDDFTLHEQGERKVMILFFPDVDLRQTFALMQLVDKRLRVDLKTSAWMMGRFLKLLSFLHESDVSTPILISNFLLEPTNHRLLMLNWTHANLGYRLTAAQQCYAIKQAAESALLLLDATYSDGEWNYNYPLEDNEASYIACLAAMHRGEFNDAVYAHANFYTTIHQLWGRGYHPFTTHQKSD